MATASAAAESDRKDTEVQWYYQSNPNPWSEEEIFLFTAYRKDISVVIEEAHQKNQGIIEVTINNIDYRIDTVKFLQISVIGTFHQRRIRRCSSERSTMTTNENRSCQRFGYEQNIEEASLTNDNINDIGYYGSKFIQEWYSFHCKKKVTLFDGLLQGIVHEGELKGQFCKAQCYANELLSLREKEKSNRKIRHKLEEFCAYLYTTHSFIHGLVNQTLRNYDRGRLGTLGPFCYLLYNYNGSENSSNLNSTVHRIKKMFSHQTSSPELVMPSQPRSAGEGLVKFVLIFVYFVGVDHPLPQGILSSIVVNRLLPTPSFSTNNMLVLPNIFDGQHFLQHQKIEQ
jgi:hypothetical protein